MQGNPGFVPALLKLTESPDPALAAPAKELSLLIDDARAVPVWMKLLEDRDWWVRARALENIGRHGRGDEVLQRVLALLNDRLTALPAVGALGAMGDPRAAGPLFELFKASKGKPDDQLEILDALALARRSEAAEGGRGPRERLEGRRPRPDRPREGPAPRRQAPGGCRPRRSARRSSPPSRRPTSSGNASPTLPDFLADTVAKGASDFHLATGFVPHQRIHGQLTPDGDGADDARERPRS